MSNNTVKSKSKDEIWLSHWDSKNWIEQASKAMDEYAEQEAIAFAEWKDDNVILPSGRNVLFVDDSDVGKEVQYYLVNEKLYEMKQLYELFKQSQQKGNNI